MPRNISANLPQLLSERSTLSASGCLEWIGCKNERGYGRLFVDGRPRLTHRLAYQTWVGPIPAGLRVLHRCDNRACINPAHLFIGTVADNNKDMCEKGRNAKGERHGKAKLTKEKVLEIRASAFGYRRLARKFSVSIYTIRDIKRGRAWAGTF